MTQELMETCAALDVQLGSQVSKNHIKLPWCLLFFWQAINNWSCTLKQHNSLAVRSGSQMFCCLFFTSFPLHIAPLLVGFVWLRFFSPHRSTDSPEAICKGILSDHVKLRLVLCMCLYTEIIVGFRSLDMDSLAHMFDLMPTPFLQR